MDLTSKQVALSGRLKPEARLGLAISEFAQTLDSERRNEFRSMQSKQDAQISGRDIIKMTEEINQEGARRHKSWRPHGTKVGGFLARIQAFAAIGDVLVGGSQNLIATGVWSAVRLSLTIATNYLGYFEKLSTLLMRLNTSWTLHEDFSRLFPTSEVLQAYFCEYLVVLMRLCNKVVMFCRRKTGAQLLSSIGSSFDSEFGPVQKELDQWGYLIQQQTQVLATRLVVDSQQDKFYNLKQQLLWRISPHQNEFETRWRRERKKGTCGWIFDTSSFEGWRSSQTSATLCISGKLGSGKTVFMANLVARMNLEQPCAYVFCASQEAISTKAEHILGSIAFNLIGNLPTEETSHRILAQNDIKQAFDPETIIDLLLRLLPKDRRYIIIADGLENCPDVDLHDVLLGLRRLSQNRLVLFCYSSRSNSRFQQVADEQLAPGYFVSHDNSNHDEELDAYIVAEVTRRNTTRHLSPDLEELVKRQLISGAQGMYLWVSLQLETIFPADSKAVVTDHEVLNLISNLPKDLPGAFEQALERIYDPKYEGKIMKLVLSAARPLELDEIRIALCVVAGEPVWHPERIAKHGTQLISLCGGNLLDLDEEDRKVRFIHHSVIQHLLSPGTAENTTSYHFTVEDAENFMGATCVTYLHLPVLDSRMTVTRNLQSQQVLDNVMGSTRHSLPGLNHLVQHIRSREQKRARPSQVDIGHILSQIQATRVQQDLDPRCFAGYATRHWVFHTRFFEARFHSWRLFWQLLCGGVEWVKPSWPIPGEQPFEALLWAIERGHGALFCMLLNLGDLRRGQITQIVCALESQKSIHGQWLGDILARYLLGINAIDASSAGKRITFLLEAGADPTVRHSTMGLSPCDIFTRQICADARFAAAEQKVIHAFFSHQAVKRLLDYRSVQDVFTWLLDNGKLVTIAEILACRPDLKSVLHQIQTKKLLAIETAQDHLNRDGKAVDMQRINTPTSTGTTLLLDAIETRNDAWVYHLLRLGADPNIGPFKMRQHIQSIHFRATCYPLEAALWLGRTRVCLELLHHGADIGRLGVSPMRIAEETNNWIMIARLQETPGWTRQLEKVWSDRPREPDGTALVTACRILSQRSPGVVESPNSPESSENAAITGDWAVELDQVIYRLARDASPEYVNTQDSQGRTALHYLSEVKTGDTRALNSIVTFLLRRGAETNLPG
ncbi:hypothetical protein KVR01_011785 [Diaporthe batatas]|uniref:uncharacterized protein n=1 Tax=Diaporthe batatas TaxID=748121 RepID=UPI001D04AB60|nr:uncharacterized protein KVR01_011785 [Diaporthe batatas]KAG8158663.1 hypothetical protein KVR01_011785 [Diaporthe batatas]